MTLALPPRRLIATVIAAACAALLALAIAAVAENAPDRTAIASPPDRAANLQLLTDPFLQLPRASGVRVVWMTEWAGDKHFVVVGNGVRGRSGKQLRRAAARGSAHGLRAFPATTRRLSRVAEDSSSNLPPDSKPPPEEGIVPRDVFRHESKVTGLKRGSEVPYRVVSVDGGAIAASGTFRLSAAAPKGKPQRILLTSDHQAMVNTPANLEMADRTVGEIDAVFLAGDLVNIPDRASEWFDDSRGSAFFPVLQGHGGRASTNGEVYRGAPIIQNAPVFPAVGNHEVQGRRAGATSLGTSFNAPVPRAVAEQAYAVVADEVNPHGDPKVRRRWIEENSFSTTTYEEIFSLPTGSPGGETYYAVTVGDVRLISLYSTRIWRGTTANPSPDDRAATSRYQEARTVLDDPLAQGWGEHIFEAIDDGSEQLRWLERELESPEFRRARFRVVMLHEGPQGLGDNVMPAFTDPVRIEERDASGEVVGVRYEYPFSKNHLLRDLQPMLEEAGVDLVHNGHSHLWNRFQAATGTSFLETSNTGNSYGAFHPLSGRVRPVPPAPWDAGNYVAVGNPGGLDPIVPTENPMLSAAGEPLPFVQTNDHCVFTILDTKANEVVSYLYDVRTPGVAPIVLDRFPLGRPAPRGGRPGRGAGGPPRPRIPSA